MKNNLKMCQFENYYLNQMINNVIVTTPSTQNTLGTLSILSTHGTIF